MKDGATEVEEWGEEEEEWGEGLKEKEGRR